MNKGFNIRNGKLHIYDKKLTTIDMFYENNKQVEALYDISEIADLPNLKRLNITETNVSDISSIEKCVNLEEFVAIMCPIEDFCPLEKLCNLKEICICAPINVFKNEKGLWDCEKGSEFPTKINLQKLKKLECLDVRGRKINIRNIKGTTKLKTLQIDNCSLTNARSLGNFIKQQKHLEFLSATDIAPALSLPFLPV